jgi:hypothetical protein
MSVKFSLEDTTKQLLNAIEKSIAWARRLEPVAGSGRYAKHYFYCPECLEVRAYYKSQVDYMRRKGKKIECFKCKVEMKPVDDQFKAEYERVMRTYCERAKSLLERAWRVLESWWDGINRVDFTSEGVRVYFDHPSYIEIYRDKKDARVRIYLHFLHRQQLDKFVELLNIVKSTGLHGEVQVDSRPDHCEVPEEVMRSLSFVRMFKELGRLPDDWYMEF